MCVVVNVVFDEGVENCILYVACWRIVLETPSLP